MSLIVLIGPQAVGKMTVGKELAGQIDGRLLYNHQTLDLFANFLGYVPATFRLSDLTRKQLFQAFVDNQETNLVTHLIFTVMVGFDQAYDVQFLEEIAGIFQQARQEVYFIQLYSDLAIRKERNTHPDRLAAKPSKRDIPHSQAELLAAAEKYQLNIPQEELARLFPGVQTLTIDNSHLTPIETATRIKEAFSLV